MERVKFLFEDHDGGKHVFSMEDEGLTWMEIVTRVIQHLANSGYIIEGAWTTDREIEDILSREFK